jgi:hypothetical protein
MLLPAMASLYGQMSSTATASTSATIIIPVGAEKSDELISGNFYPGKGAGTVVLNSDGIIINGKAGTNETGRETVIPYFHVSAGQSFYSITLSYDPFIVNRKRENESMHIELFIAAPENKKNPGQMLPDTYSIGTKLQVGPYQLAGEYCTTNPFRVTINFN